MRKVSIIIPVFNQWQLTRGCLKSLKATLPPDIAQIIVVDNASSDPTPKAAPFLGKELFGEDFVYIRNEQNRNFACATNQGAKAASGQFLVFLNNDTEAQAGWLPPLLEDFQQFPDIAATGPLLLYPEKPLIGHTVQHLGVTVSPFYKVSHLYEGLPAASPLAKKRRFFQIITGACQMMPRKLFFEAACFDEEYVNGFEDVDLCAKLTVQGYRFTVNPEAQVIHFQGKTDGRSDAELKNSKYFDEHALRYLKPDKAQLFEADGFRLGLNDWQNQMPRMPQDQIDNLKSKIGDLDAHSMISTLIDYPFFTDGWQKLLNSVENVTATALCETVYRLVQEPWAPMLGCRNALILGDSKQAVFYLNTARPFAMPASAYLESALIQAKYARHLRVQVLANAYSEWAESINNFASTLLEPFLLEFAVCARNLQVPLPSAISSSFSAST